MRRAICPHCHTTARIEKTREVTALVRDHYVDCKNFDCGFTFVVRSEIIYGIRPSMKPDPAVNLPSSARYFNSSQPMAPAPTMNVRSRCSAAQRLHHLHGGLAIGHTEFQAC